MEHHGGAFFSVTGNGDCRYKCTNNYLTEGMFVTKKLSSILLHFENKNSKNQFLKAVLKSLLGLL